MKITRTGVPVYLSLAIMFSPCGCGRPSSPEIGDVAGIEPSHADVADESAALQFRQASESDSHHEIADWPQLFGPSRTSAVSGTINPFWGSEGPREIWNIPVGTGYGSPIVAGGRVIFTHRDGDEEIVQCVDAETGQARWEHRHPTTFKCEYEYSDGPYSTPVLFEDLVYVLGGQGQLHALEFETGKPIWSRDLFHDYALEDDIFAVGCSPAVVYEKLIVNIGAREKQAGIIALDRESGKTLWESTDHGAAYCSPFAATIHGEPFVFVVTDTGLVSLHPETGELDWMIEHRCRAPMSFNSVSPLVHEDKVLVVTGPGPGALCVQVQPDRTFKTVWKNRRVIDCQFNTLLLSDNNVFGFTAAGQGGAEFRCVDFSSGKLKWKYHSLLRRGQGLIVGNAIVLLGERGHLASLLLSDQSPQVLAFTDQPLMQEPCYCSPAYASGRLYLKDEERIACFDVD